MPTLGGIKGRRAPSGCQGDKLLNYHRQNYDFWVSELNRQGEIMMKNSTLIGALASLIATASLANPLTWNLNGVTFNDGTSANGSFVFDVDTLTYTSWSINTTPTIDATNTGYFFGGANYTTNAQTVASTGAAQNQVELHIRDDSFIGTHFKLRYASPLTNSGGTIALGGINGAGAETFGGFPRTIVAGSVTSPVPETQTYLLMIAGLAVISYIIRKRSQTTPLDV